MVDILNPNGDNNLKLQQERQIPSLNLKPSTFDPAAATPASPPQAQLEPATTTAPLLEEAPKASSGAADSLVTAAPATDTTVVPTQSVAPIPGGGSTRPGKLLQSYDTFREIAPAFDINPGDVQDTDVYFQATHGTPVYFDALNSGKMSPTVTDSTAEDTLARLKAQNQTPLEQSNTRINSQFANMQGQEIQHNGIFNLDKSSTAAYIPEPEKLQYQSSDVQRGIGAIAQNAIAKGVQDNLGRWQFESSEIRDKPFDWYVPQFDNQLQPSPSLEDIYGAMSQRVAATQPQNAPATKGIDATSNAIQANFSNLIDGDRRGGAASKRQGDITIVGAVGNALYNGAFDLGETALGVVSALGVGAQTVGRSFVNLLEGEGINSFKNAFNESMNTEIGAQARQTFDKWTGRIGQAPDSPVRKQQDFRPLQGEFGDYGSGTLGAVFYAMDLPSNILLSGVYSVADAVDLDKRMSGQNYTGNRFADALTGRDMSFSQRRDSVSYLSPVARDPNKSTTTAVSQWGSAFVLDILTGGVSDAAVGLARKGARESVQTSRRFASESLPNFSPKAAPARVATNATPTPTPRQLLAAPNARPEIKTAGRSAALPNQPAPMQILTPPPAPAATRGTNYITSPSHIWEPTAAQSLEAQGMNTQLMAQKLVEHNRRNAPGVPRQQVAAIANSTVPNAPVAAVPVITPQQIVHNVERSEQLRRQLNPSTVTTQPVILQSTIPNNPQALSHPRTAAEFVQRAVDDGAVTVDEAGKVAISSELFTEQVAKRTRLESTQESLLATLDRPLAPEVKEQVAGQLAVVQKELSTLSTDVALPASQRTIDVAAREVVDDVPQSVIRNAPPERTQLALAGELEQETKRLGAAVEATPKSATIEELFNNTQLKKQTERVVSLAEESGVDVQLALKAANVPDMPVEKLEQVIGRSLQNTVEPSSKMVPVLDLPATAFDEAVPPGEGSRVVWTNHPLNKKGAIYDVKTEELDKAWKRGDPTEYVGNGGENGIGDRYNQIGEHLKNNPELHMPIVDIGTNGDLRFVDGRHRTAWARDKGEASIPVFVRNPAKVGNMSGWVKRGQVGKTVTAADVDKVIPVVPKTQLSAPVSPADVQAVTRQAAAKRVPAPPINPDEVRVVKRTNAQLTAIARNTVDPDTGKPIWKYKRNMTSKELEAAEKQYGNILARHGKAVDAEVLNAPVKRVELEAPNPVTGTARKTQLSQAAPVVPAPAVLNAADITNTEKYALQQKIAVTQNELNTLMSGSDFSNKAQARMSKLENRLWELQEQLDEVDTMENYVKTSPQSIKPLAFVPAEPETQKLQSIAAVTETELKRAGEEAKRLEQQLVDMTDSLLKTKEQYADVAHAARQNIENEFTTREWSGLIKPEDSPNRIRLERADVSGVPNKASKSVPNSIEHAKNLGVKNPNEETLAHLAANILDYAYQVGRTNEDIAKRFDSIVEAAVSDYNKGKIITTPSRQPVVRLSDKELAKLDTDSYIKELEAAGVDDYIEDYQAPLYYDEIVLKGRPIDEVVDKYAFYNSADEIPKVTPDSLVEGILGDKKVNKKAPPTDMKTAIERFHTYGESRQKELKELLPNFSITDPVELLTLESWQDITKEANRLFSLASNLDQTSNEIKNGLKGYAVERLARFAGDASAERVFTSKKLDMKDIVANVIGDEQPVSRASLKASEDRIGIAAPLVRKWSKQLGQTVWSKLTTDEDKIKFLKTLHADELSELGISYKVATASPAPKLSPERVAAQAAAAELNGTTFYHGTKLAVNDLSVLDPAKGASFGELGSGIYLTNSPADAEHYAKAYIPENKFPTGDVRSDAIGSVHEVTVNVSQPLDGNLPLPLEIRQQFTKYLKEVHPDIPYKPGTKTSASTLLLKVREAAQATVGDVPVGEARMVEIQRVYTDIIKSQGYDAVVKVNRDGTLTTAILDPTRLKTSRRTPIGDGSAAEALFSRKYLDEFMHSTYPNYEYTRANMLKSRIEAEEYMFQDVQKSWESVSAEAEDAAKRLGDTENALSERSRLANRAAADAVERNTADSPKQKLKTFMKDTDNLCL